MLVVGAAVRQKRGQVRTDGEVLLAHLHAEVGAAAPFGHEVRDVAAGRPAGRRGVLEVHLPDVVRAPLAHLRAAAAPVEVPYRPHEHLLAAVHVGVAALVAGVAVAHDVHREPVAGHRVEVAEVEPVVAGGAGARAAGPGVEEVRPVVPADVHHQVAREEVLGLVEHHLVEGVLDAGVDLELREFIVLVRELEEVAAADVVLLDALDGGDVHRAEFVGEHARVHPAEVLRELSLVRHADRGELRGDRRVLQRGLADRLGRVLPVVDVHAVLAHADVLAELVAAEELPVEDHVHPRALLPHGHAQLVRHVVGDLVAEHPLVVVVREEHPVLVLDAVGIEAEHVGLGVELELVGLLGEPLRGVAAHLDRERAAVDFLGGELRLAEDRAHRRVVFLLLRGGHQAVVRLDVEDGEPAHVVAADADETVLVIRLHEQPMAVVRGCDGVAGGCREDVVGAAEGAVHAPPHVAERAERFAVVGRDAERQFRAGGHAVAGWCVERDRRARRLGRGLLSAESAHAARAAEDDVVDVVLHVVVGAVRLVAPA